MHTSGEWFIDLDRTVYSKTHGVICEVRSGGPGIEGADANALLIAAAPDLLAALQGLLAATEAVGSLVTVDAVIAAKRAIARATQGQG